MARDGNKMRGLPTATGLILLLASAACRSRGEASAGLELQTEDYGAARSHFQTALVQHAGAPQQGGALRPPPGAEQVEYDPVLHLVAWVTPGAGHASGPPRPAVLFLHGGFAIGDDDWEMTRPYRDAGYVVMTPAVRGENGQNGAYSMFYDEVTDVTAAAEYLSRMPGVDGAHVYLAGHSIGGTLSMLAALTWPHFKAAASFSGAPDPIAWSRGQTDLIVFDPKNVREFQMRAPIAFAGSFKCATRIYYGSGEPGFAGSSRETAVRASKHGLDVQAVEVAGDHFSAVPEEIRLSIEFFKTH